MKKSILLLLLTIILMFSLSVFTYASTKDMVSPNSNDHGGGSDTTQYIASVEIISLSGNQYVVKGRSATRTQTGLPKDIDYIYVRARLWKLENGQWILIKQGQNENYNSSDAMYESTSTGIVSVPLEAKGDHIYRRAGYQDVYKTSYASR